MNPVVESDAADVIRLPQTDRERTLCEYMTSKIDELKGEVAEAEGSLEVSDNERAGLEDQVYGLEQKLEDADARFLKLETLILELGGEVPD